MKPGILIVILIGLTGCIDPDSLNDLQQRCSGEDCSLVCEGSSASIIGSAELFAAELDNSCNTDQDCALATSVLQTNCSLGCHRVISRNDLARWSEFVQVGSVFDQSCNAFQESCDSETLVCTAQAITPVCRQNRCVGQ